MAVLVGPLGCCGESFFEGDVEVGPNHAEFVELGGALVVQAVLPVGAAGVGDPLPEREIGQRCGPPLALRLVASR